jgi:hypothetical protein
MSTTYHQRPAATPAYYLGRPAGTWRTALRRRNRNSRLELTDATTIDRGRKADDRAGAMQ